VLAHTLTHWRYHLNEWVIDYLDGMGHMHADEILRRNDMSTKKKTRNANDVLDQMVERGIVDGLWRDFHISLRSAREKEVCLYSILSGVCLLIRCLVYFCLRGFFSHLVPQFHGFQG
jgi:hypothetical protein